MPTSSIKSELSGPILCGACGAVLTIDPRARGRIRRFCANRCRVAYHRGARPQAGPLLDDCITTLDDLAEGTTTYERELQHIKKVLKSYYRQCSRQPETGKEPEPAGNSFEGVNRLEDGPFFKLVNRLIESKRYKDLKAENLRLTLSASEIDAITQAVKDTTSRTRRVEQEREIVRLFLASESMTVWKLARRKDWGRDTIAKILKHYGVDYADWEARRKAVYPDLGADY